MWRAVAALLVALAIQVATNYQNDVADGVRGTDTGRVGPTRLVASGLATPSAVKKAALVAMLVAAVAGLALAVAVTPWLLLVGAASFAAGYFYTGWTAALWLPRAGRGVRLRVLRSCRDRGLGLRADRGDHGGRGRGVDPRRPAGDRPPRREQPARHPDRRTRGQANARGPHGRPQDAVLLRRTDRRRVRSAARVRRARAAAGRTRVPRGARRCADRCNGCSRERRGRRSSRCSARQGDCRSCSAPCSRPASATCPDPARLRGLVRTRPDARGDTRGRRRRSCAPSAFDPINARHALGVRGEAFVEGSADEENGHREGAQPLPQWLLRARPGEPQARGEPLDGVLTAGVRITRVQAGESRRVVGRATASGTLRGRRARWTPRAASSRSRRAARSVGSSMPAVPLTSTSRSTRSGWVMAVCNTIRAPIE